MSKPQITVTASSSNESAKPHFVSLSCIYGGGDRMIHIGRFKFRWPLPIAYMLRSSCARVFGAAVYGGRKRFWIKPVYRAFVRVRECKLWLMYRLVPRHQYHLVRTKLEPGYYDIDTLMLHACMALLCRYVEVERGGAEDLEQRATDLQDPLQQDPNAPDGLERAIGEKEDEALLIYRWWKVQRPKDHARRDWLLHELYGKKDRVSWKPTEHPQLSEMAFEEFVGDEVAMHEEFRALEEKIADDEQKMLHRLIDIRGGLWT